MLTTGEKWSQDLVSANILCENGKTDLKEGENESCNSQTVLNQMSFEGFLNRKSEVSLKIREMY